MGVVFFAIPGTLFFKFEAIRLRASLLFFNIEHSETSIWTVGLLGKKSSCFFFSAAILKSELKEKYLTFWAEKKYYTAVEIFKTKLVMQLKPCRVMIGIFNCLLW